MLLSRKDRFLFIHIQKTAGTSLVQAIKSALPNVEDFLRPHAPYLHAEQAIEDLSRYRTVAFVRNPFDRLVSWYSMISGSGRLLTEEEQRNNPNYNRIWQYVLSHSENFEDFILNCADAEDRAGWKPFLYNQIDYLKDSRGRVAVSYIGRFEALAVDVERIFGELGLAPIKLPHLNVSTRGDYREYYTPRLRQVVEKRFAGDIKTFGYAF